MTEPQIKTLLTHLLYSQVKLNDAPASAQTHLDYVIAELYKMVENYKPEDDDCKKLLNDAVEHMKFYKKN